MWDRKEEAKDNVQILLQTTGKKNCFDQNSQALAIFWTSDAKLIILWLFTGPSCDHGSLHRTKPPAQASTKRRWKVFSLSKHWLKEMVVVMGLCGKVFVAGGTIWVASVRSCEKLPPFWSSHCQLAPRRTWRWPRPSQSAMVVAPLG